ncbi:MAG: hypothetical protein IPN91_14090 [Holophagaceae bacterium]|uniref:Uncharacterized protein n=1 Tax=Candidatus Geothrix odensensis TaxID=2954440 RepID=A0A936F453_9BACT|nr:hypothetical protein [Candidatus Geothrix odensensis]
MKTRLITSLGFALALSAMLPLAGQGLVTPLVSVVKGEKNFKTGYDPINVDGTINAIIEIPAGTTAKY